MNTPIEPRSSKISKKEIDELTEDSTQFSNLQQTNYDDFDESDEYDEDGYGNVFDFCRGQGLYNSSAVEDDYDH